MISPLRPHSQAPPKTSGLPGACQEAWPDPVQPRDSLEKGRPADSYRQAARQLLQSPSVSSREIEITGLSLFERELLSKGPGQTEKLASHSLHGGALAALLGTPAGALTPALQKVLDDFQVFHQPRRTGELRTLGDFDSQIAAARAVGPSTPLDCGLPIGDKAYSIPLHGFSQPQEVANLQAAFQEITSKTGTKALHLVKEIYLRPFLAESVDTQGNAQIVDGLAHGRQTVGIIHATARDAQNLRHTFFHELGHELDHILSGGTTFFRSSQADNPFGKSQVRADYLSDYAMTSPAEDFAECHAQLIQEWDLIREQPDLFVHSRGKIGEKLAWILVKGYRESLPPPSPGWNVLQSAVQAGDAPISAQDWPTVTEGLRKNWPHPQGAQETWLAEQLREIANKAVDPQHTL